MRSGSFATFLLDGNPNSPLPESNRASSTQGYSIGFTMPIFRIENQKVQQLGVKKDGFGKEKDLQDFFAENLEQILGVRFLAKEFKTPDGRIDTLGIDENNSPVIIEYKWKENEEVF